MTASTAPEEGGRRIWLKIHCGNVIRKVEWNTTWKGFENLESKVRQLFHLDNRTKLVVQYKEKDDVITMSSDEEFAVALELLSGDVLTTFVEPVKKKKRGTMARAIRAGKTAKLRLLAVGTAVSTAVGTSIPAISMPSIHPSRYIHAACRRICSVTKENTWLAVLLVSILCLSAICYFTPPSIAPRVEKVEILAATYGNRDVTATTAQYYAHHQQVLAANRLYGDPLIGQHKFLHVFYRVTYSTGKSAIISEGFLESGSPRKLSLRPAECSTFHSSETIVDGRKINVLGAVYDDTDVSCHARKLIPSGLLRSGSTANIVRGQHFEVEPHTHGFITMFYEEKGRLKFTQAREGAAIRLL